MWWAKYYNRRKKWWRKIGFLGWACMAILVFTAVSCVDHYLLEDSLFKALGIYHPPYTTKNESIKAIEIINEIRAKNRVKPIKWDERAYEMALFRAKDMYKRDYFSHKTPEGLYPKDLKYQFGFTKNELICENIAKTEYSYDFERAIDLWANSMGHFLNMITPSLDKGAVACYQDICVFIGVDER